MKLRNLMIGVFTSLAVFAGCENMSENLGAPDIAISTSEMSFEIAGGEQDLTLYATRDWKVESDASWVVVNPESGAASAEDQKVTVTVLPNDEEGALDRTADLKFTIGMKSKYLTVTQAGAGGSAEALIVYSNDFDITKAQNNSGWPYLDSNYDLWDNKKGTGAENVTYAFGGKMSVRTSGKLSNDGSGFSHYAGSGMNKIFFGAATSIFKIQNIALGETSKYKLSFGGQRYTQDDASNIFSFDEFKVYLSNDTEKWVPVNMAFPADSDLDGDWNLASASFTLPAGTDELSIAFVCTKSSAYSIDDVLLEVGTEAGQTIDFTAGEAIGGTTGGGGNTGGDTTAPESKGKKTVEEFIAAADTQNYYELTGTVSGFNPTYCSFDLTDATGKIYVYSVLDASKAEWTSKISNGGTITIYGKYLYYEQKSQHEVVDAHIVNFTAGTVERPTDITDVTVEEFLKKEVDDTWYRLSGTVSGTLNTTYGNFDLTDETGSVYVYGIDNWSSYSAKFAVGDKVTIVGHRYIYTNPNDGSVKDEVMDAYIESWTAGEGNTGSGGGNGGELDPDAAWSYLFANGDLGDSYSAPVTKTLNGAEWSFAMTGSTFLGWDSNNGRGLQMGKSKEPASEVTLSTSGISGNIKKIVVNTAGASGTDAELVVKVGETALGSPVKTTTKATDYTFEAETAVSGAVELKWTLTTAAVYIKSISVYTE